MQRRLADLREQRLDGVQTLSGFLSRRFAPAMAFCESTDARLTDVADRINRAVSLALMEAHYFRHRLFLEPDQLLRDLPRIRHLPATIVHGRYDIICPMKSAWDLSQAWPEADLRVVLAGHSAADPAIVDALVAATDALADRFG